MAELLTGQVLFPGADHIDQLTRILQIVGSPDTEFMQKITSDSVSTHCWPGSAPIILSPPPHQARAYICSLPVYPKKDFATFFQGANPLAINLLDMLLTMDPDRRISAEDSLAHPYLANYADPDDEVRANHHSLPGMLCLSRMPRL